MRNAPPPAAPRPAVAPLTGLAAGLPSGLVGRRSGHGAAWLGHDADALAPEQLAGRINLMQLVQLRWLAVAGQLLTIVVVQALLGIPLPLLPMLALLAGLVLFNGVCAWRARTARRVTQHELLAGLLVDLVVLTGLLAMSGGVNNPFLFIYLLQVTLGAMLLRGAHIWAMVLLACGAIVLLSQWHLPLRWPDGPVLPMSRHYLAGLLLCFALCAALVVVFIHRIGANLRQRDARVAALRQQAAEEDHIVRLGLLASGAAHELGTPLATLSVILGDWARMAPLAGQPELREDIAQMQAQVQRCKAIISGILLSAGDARGDAPQVTTLAEFLDGLMADWCQRRDLPALACERGPMPPTPIVADTGLQQMVGNVLDNALEAAPDQWPRLLAQVSGPPGQQRLELRVLDRGPGFTPEMRANLGRPYHSTKGRPGGGLGLFLSLNVARKLGGNIQALPRETGGTEVLIDLPLASLVPRGLPPPAA